MPLPSLAQIKERKIVQWGLAYLGGAWLVLQVAAVLSGAYGWPAVVMRALPVVLAVGFVAALVLAWYHGERGEQKASGIELSILAVLLALAGLGVMIVAPSSEADLQAVEATMEEEDEADRTWLAVLTFDAIGEDENHFAEGMTAELTETLAQIPDLRVIAQTSASAFEDSAAPVESIGRALGVDYLVEGTVRSLGDRVRVTARLVEVATGAQEWSESFDRSVDDVFAVQRAIAQAVAGQLRMQVGTMALDAQGTSDPEAYRLVLRSNHLRFTGGDTFEAMRLAREALARDSTYASAWFAVCGSHYLFGAQGLTDDDEEQYELMRAACERAIALDPNHAMALRALGVYHAELGGDEETAVRLYERAIEANPSHALALALLARIRLRRGDEREAVRLVERAVATDPYSNAVLLHAASVHYAVGNPERAVVLTRDNMTLRPDDPSLWSSLGVYLAGAGQTEEAIAWTRRALEADPSPDWFWVNAAYAFARAGRRAEAERHLGEVAEQTYYHRAAVEAALGDRDAAFAALDRSVESEEMERTIREWARDPWLAPLHDDPRWERLMSRVRADPPQGG